MKRIYQFIAVILTAFAITGCFNKEDLKADVAAIENIAEKSENIKNAYTLLNQIPTLTTAEERANAAKQVAAEATKLKNDIGALKLTSPDGKTLQTEFVATFNQLTEFANQLSQFSTTQPTQEQQVAFTQLLQQVSSNLVKAGTNLQVAKAKAEQQAQK